LLDTDKALGRYEFSGLPNTAARCSEKAPAAKLFRQM